MNLLADTHVHLYPSFPLEAVFAHARQNLAPEPDAFAGLLLTERAGEHWFRDLSRGEISLPAGLRAEVSIDGQGQWLMDAEASRILVVPGRQIITAERIEILCLTRDLELADGMKATEVLKTIRLARGVAVLPWSPGKWLGNRGVVVRELIDTSEPGTVLVGDTVMRPRISPEPAVFKRARHRGIRCLAGTDPLPLPGEEYHDWAVWDTDPVRPRSPRSIACVRR